MSRHSRTRRPGPIAFAGPLVALAVAVLWDGFAAGLPAPASSDREGASFTACAGAVRADCVVDGDTFWYRGRKFRIADINTPETGAPRCRREAELGTLAARRLTQLLNAGAFSLERVDRERDSYGRMLRVVTRAGTSLGGVLEREGLAEHWGGHRRGWC